MVPIGNIKARNGYYVKNDVTVWRRSFYLHTISLTISYRLASLFVVHDPQTPGSTLSAGPQSVLPASWSELLVQHVVVPPWLLAMALPRRRRMNPSPPDRRGCLSVVPIVSCEIRSASRFGLTNSRHLPTHETCGLRSTVYLVVVIGRATKSVLTNSPGFHREGGADPVNYFCIITADISSCSTWSVIHRVHVHVVG